MGNYLNPDNSKFQRAVNSDIYVDKTGLIKYTNRVMNTMQAYVCVSRPRRFGKSMAADMLTAYYSKGCYSREVFSGLEITEDETFDRYLNKYDTVFLNVQEFLSRSSDVKELIARIKQRVIRELTRQYPDVELFDSTDLAETMQDIYAESKCPFVLIIDEWDCIFREFKNDKEAQEKYLDFLRDLIKDKSYIHLAYMTGILPIKKDGSQSAISDFEEFTMVKPRKFAPYVGFTEQEVKNLCSEYQIDFSKMKLWYDGYSFPNANSIYNPNSVMKALRNDDFDSYWTQTSAAESLMEYISLDYDGLSKTIAELIGGIEVEVDTSGFSNDLVTFREKDDVLTLLIHLGYLAYDKETEKVHIPNEEIKREFSRTIRGVRRNETIQRVRESDQIISDTVHMNADAVATQIEKIHIEETTALFYNNEQALRSVIKLAYFSYRDYYLKFEELPSGNGYADIVYFPKKTSNLPALVVEMKWDKSAEGAITQIKKRNYPAAIKDFGGEILLVGINYDKKTKEHSCKIEEYRK